MAGMAPLQKGKRPKVGSQSKRSDVSSNGRQRIGCDSENQSRTSEIVPSEQVREWRGDAQRSAVGVVQYSTSTVAGTGTDGYSSGTSFRGKHIVSTYRLGAVRHELRVNGRIDKSDEQTGRQTSRQRDNPAKERPAGQPASRSETHGADTVGW